MNKSEDIKELASALSKFQAEVKNPQNSETVKVDTSKGSYKYKYAPLDEILSLVRPLLGKNGLSVVQPASSDGAEVTVVTLLLHSSGQWMEFEPLKLKADRNTAQGIGSAITYGRRYALSGILGISSEDDDDGQAAVGKSNEYKSQSKNQNSKPSGKDKDKSEAKLKCSDCNADITAAVDTFSTKKYGKSLCRDCQKKQ